MALWPYSQSSVASVCVFPIWVKQLLECLTAPQWASCQIHKIAGAHAPGMPGTFSPPPQVSDPDMHHGTCVTHVPWCMPGSLTSSFLWNRRRGKTFPAFPAHAQPAILRICQEAHWKEENTVLFPRQQVTSAQLVRHEISWRYIFPRWRQAVTFVFQMQQRCLRRLNMLRINQTNRYIHAKYYTNMCCQTVHMDGFWQVGIISIANALKIPQYCTKPW